jgi:hypothetical protein
MAANDNAIERSELAVQMEPGLPYFLNGFDADPDDLGDWWLDLGAVDLNGVTGM